MAIPLIDKMPSSKKAVRIVQDQNVEILSRLEAIENGINRNFARIEQADKGVNDNVNFRSEWLKSANQSENNRLETMLWELYRKEGEDLLEAKCRFFFGLSPATGGLRALQLGCAQLLKEFDSLCSEHNLRYWIAFGTLLGAVRHRGFIPWDDDSDLGMMRSDIVKLIELMQNDDRYRVSIIYDAWNFCKQVRFMYSDTKNPCFLDLFIFEETSNPSEDTFDSLNQLRNEMIEELKTASFFPEWKEREFIDPSNPISSQIETVFQSYRSKAIEKDLISDKTDEQGMVWGIENLNDLNGYRWICNKDNVFPQRTLAFEGVVCKAPSNIDKFLTEVYGDIYRLPRDMGTHCPHVSQEQIAALSQSADKRN